MNAEARLIFMKYAIPCAGTIVRRGQMTQGQVDQLIERVAAGKAPEDGTERLFPVADAMCKMIARQMGKNEVDAETVHEYFRLRHSKVVDERHELMKDFDPVACRTYPGIVVGVKDGHAVVETVRGRKAYNTVLAKDVKEGDNVSVHFNFVVEKISERVAEEMRAVASNEKRNERNNAGPTRSRC